MEPLKREERTERPPIPWAHLEAAIELLVKRLRDMGHQTAEPEEVLAGLDQCLMDTDPNRPHPSSNGGSG